MSAVRDIQLGARRVQVAGIVSVQPGLSGAAAVVSVSPVEPRFADAEETTDPGPRRRAVKEEK